MRTPVLAMIERHGMLPAGVRVLVGVSGGADSVALLHLLRELTPKSVAGVAHFNHGLRGAESDADEAFVAELAASMGLAFYRGTATLGEGNMEQNGRQARAAFFRGLVEAGHGERIAVGHTRDDQAETVLFRLLRGSGLTGLAGILPVTAEGLIRPLLGVGRQDLRAYLREQGLEWREDSSNTSARFARNRIRHSLLPALEREWNPRIVDVLAQLADVAYEEEAWWAEELARHGHGLRGGTGEVELFVPALLEMPRALARRLLRKAIALAKGDLLGIDYAHVEQLVSLTEAGAARRSLPGLVATRSFDWLQLRLPGARPQLEAISLEGPGTYPRSPAKPLIRCVISDDAGCDTLELELRGWRAGDRYQPVGRTRSMKLTELFQEARVPSWRRSSWPMVTNKGKILWAKGFGPAEGAHGVTVEEIPDAAESFAVQETS